MNDTSASITQLALDAASNPKIATAVAAGSASTGIAAQLDLITGYVAMVSVWIGAITGAVVLLIQLFKLPRSYRAWRNKTPLSESE